MYCLDCGYNLKGLTTRECPECGRHFEPTNLNTIAASSPKEPAKDEIADFGKKMALWIAFVFFVIAVALGWVVVHLFPLIV